MTLAAVPGRCRPVEGVTVRPLPALLWVDLSGPLSGDEQADVSADEHRKASRFRCAQDRRRYLAAHVALRHMLAERGAGDASALRFRSNAWGKPELCEQGGLRFNLSHSKDIGLIGSSFSHDLGVDVEIMRDLPDASELVIQYFTLAERHEFESLPPSERSRSFLIGWTRKEACLKAIGVGLGASAQSVDVGLTASSRWTRVLVEERSYFLEVQSIVGWQTCIGAVAQLHLQGAPASWAEY